MFIQRKCLSEFYLISLFWEVLKFHPHTFLVATIPTPDDSGKPTIVGYVFCIIESGKRFDFIDGRRSKDQADLCFHPVGNVYSLAVLPAYRQQGIATQLLTEAVARLFSQGCRHVFLNVRESNTKAIALYEKVKFTRSVATLDPSPPAVGQ